MTQQNSVSRSLIEQLKALEHLQELDLKIDHLKKSKGSLPDALRALDQNLAKVTTSVNTKQAALNEIEKNHRQTQAALDINRDRLTRANSRMEGVQNSQEFNAIQKEQEQLKKQSASLDEQSKKASSESEAIQKEMSTLNAQLQKLREERETQAGVLAGQSSKLDTEINLLLDERKQYTAQVEARLLAQYDRVRGARAGLGLVPAVAGRCKGCNMMVPPQLFNEIRKGQTVHACPSCHRILFVPMASESSGTSGGVTG